MGKEKRKHEFLFYVSRMTAYVSGKANGSVPPDYQLQHGIFFKREEPLIPERGKDLDKGKSYGVFYIRIVIGGFWTGRDYGSAVMVRYFLIWMGNYRFIPCISGNADAEIDQDQQPDCSAKVFVRMEMAVNEVL